MEDKLQQLFEALQADDAYNVGDDYDSFAKIMRQDTMKSRGLWEVLSNDDRYVVGDKYSAFSEVLDLKKKETLSEIVSKASSNIPLESQSTDSYYGDGLARDLADLNRVVEAYNDPSKLDQLTKSEKREYKRAKKHAPDKVEYSLKEELSPELIEKQEKYKSVYGIKGSMTDWLMEPIPEQPQQQEDVIDHTKPYKQEGYQEPISEPISEPKIISEEDISETKEYLIAAEEDLKDPYIQEKKAREKEREGLTPEETKLDIFMGAPYNEAINENNEIVGYNVREVKPDFANAIKAGEFFQEKAYESSATAQLAIFLEAAGGSIGDEEGVIDAYGGSVAESREKMSRYKDPGALETVASFVGIVADIPMFMATGGTGRVAMKGSQMAALAWAENKLVASGIKREVAKRAIKIDVMKKAAAQRAKTSLYKGVTEASVVSGSALGGHSAIADVLHQMGDADFDGWDYKQTLKTGAGSFALGVGVGTVGIYTRNLNSRVKDKMFDKILSTGKYSKGTLNKINLTEFGIGAGGFSAEIGLFEASKLMSGEPLTLKGLGETVTTIGGLKIVHAPSQIKAKRSATKAYKIDLTESEIRDIGGGHKENTLSELKKDRKFYEKTINNPDVPYITKAKLIFEIDGGKVINPPAPASLELDGEKINIYDKRGELLERRDVSNLEGNLLSEVIILQRNVDAINSIERLSTATIEEVSTVDAALKKVGYKQGIEDALIKESALNPQGATSETAIKALADFKSATDKIKDKVVEKETSEETKEAVKEPVKDKDYTIKDYTPEDYTRIVYEAEGVSDMGTIDVEIQLLEGLAQKGKLTDISPNGTSIGKSSINTRMGINEAIKENPVEFVKNLRKAFNERTEQLKEPTEPKTEKEANEDLQQIINSGKKPSGEQLFNFLESLPEGTVVQSDSDSRTIIGKKHISKNGTETYELVPQVKIDKGEWEDNPSALTIVSKKYDGTYSGKLSADFSPTSSTSIKTGDRTTVQPRITFDKKVNKEGDTKPLKPQEEGAAQQETTIPPKTGKSATKGVEDVKPTVTETKDGISIELNKEITDKTSKLKAEQFEKEANEALEVKRQEIIKNIKKADTGKDGYIDYKGSRYKVTNKPDGTQSVSNTTVKTPKGKASVVTNKILKAKVLKEFNKESKELSDIQMEIYDKEVAKAKELLMKEAEVKLNDYEAERKSMLEKKDETSFEETGETGKKDSDKEQGIKDRKDLTEEEGTPDKITIDKWKQFQKELKIREKAFKIGLKESKENLKKKSEALRELIDIDGGLRPKIVKEAIDKGFEKGTKEHQTYVAKQMKDKGLTQHVPSRVYQNMLKKIALANTSKAKYKDAFDYVDRVLTETKFAVREEKKLAAIDFISKKANGLFSKSKGSKRKPIAKQSLKTRLGDISGIQRLNAIGTLLRNSDALEAVATYKINKAKNVEQIKNNKTEISELFKSKYEPDINRVNELKDKNEKLKAKNEKIDEKIKETNKSIEDIGRELRHLGLSFKDGDAIRETIYKNLDEIEKLRESEFEKDFTELTKLRRENEILEYGLIRELTLENVEVLKEKYLAMEDALKTQAKEEKDIYLLELLEATTEVQEVTNKETGKTASQLGIAQAKNRWWERPNEASLPSLLNMLAKFDNVIQSENLLFHDRLNGRYLERLVESEAIKEKLTQGTMMEMTETIKEIYGVSRDGQIKRVGLRNNTFTDKTGVFTYKDGKKMHEVTLSQMTALEKWFQWKDPEGKRLMSMYNQKAQMGFTEESMIALEKFLKPETMKLGEWMVNKKNELAGKYDEVYKRANGTSFLNSNDFHWVLTREASEAYNTSAMLENMQNGGIKNDRTLRRVKSDSPLMYTSVIETFNRYVAEAGRYVSKNDIYTEMSRVFSDPTVRSNINRNFGTEHMEALQWHLDIMSGKANRYDDRIIDRQAQRAAQGIILAKRGPVVKQILSLMNFGLEMGLGKVMLRTPLAATHLLKIDRATRALLMEQPFVEFRNNFAAMLGMEFAVQPRKMPVSELGLTLAHIKSYLPLRFLIKTAAAPLKMMDRFPIIRGGSVFLQDRYKKISGKSLTTKDITDYRKGKENAYLKQAIKDWEIMSMFAQQTTREINTSKARGSTSFGRAASFGTSAPAQMHRLVSSFSRDLNKAVKTGDAKKIRQATEKIAIGHLLTGAVFTLADLGFHVDTKSDAKRLIIGTIIGPSGGMLWTGQMFKLIQATISKDWWAKDGLQLSPIVDNISAIFDSTGKILYEHTSSVPNKDEIRRQYNRLGAEASVFAGYPVKGYLDLFDDIKTAATEQSDYFRTLSGIREKNEQTGDLPLMERINIGALSYNEVKSQIEQALDIDEKTGEWTVNEQDVKTILLNAHKFNVNVKSAFNAAVNAEKYLYMKNNKRLAKFDIETVEGINIALESEDIDWSEYELEYLEKRKANLVKEDVDIDDEIDKLVQKLIDEADQYKHY